MTPLDMVAGAWVAIAFHAAAALIAAGSTLTAAAVMAAIALVAHAWLEGRGPARPA